MATHEVAPTRAPGASGPEALASFDIGVAFDEAATGMALVGLDGRWVRVNKALCDLLGRPCSEVVGRSYQELTHEEDLAVGAPFIAGNGAKAPPRGVSAWPSAWCVPRARSCTWR
ncbi:MAG: PAS domain S-box protein [Acidimicrobiales bacterium]